jgi:outer membrane usher protein
VRSRALTAAWLAVALCRCALGATTPYAESIAEITVNGEAGQTLVVRRDTSGGLLLSEADLSQLRLSVPSLDPLVIDDQRYYRVDDLTGANIAIDDATQSIRLTLPPSAFVATRGDAGVIDAPKVTPAQPGGFVNYDLFGEKVTDESTLGAIFETGAFGTFGVLTSSALAQRADSRSSVVRLDSTWTLDLPERLATVRVGDWVSTAGAWGAAARFGGMHFGTNFATQPTLVTTPLLSAQGEAVLPSTVDVYVNGQRTAHQNVPPGPFSIDRVPAINGAGQMQVVVTDVLGRQQVLSQPYYTGPALLRAGLNEYAIDTGAIREDYARRSNEYGNLVVSGTFRRGISDDFTAEVHAEGRSGGAHAAGIDAALRVGTFGVATLTTALGGDGGSGWLGGVGFEHDGSRLSTFVQTRYTSEDFAQLGTDARPDRLKLRTFAGVGFHMDRYGSLQLSTARQTFWNRPTADVFGLTHSVTLGDFGFLSFTVSHARADESSTDVFVSWTIPFRERNTATMSIQKTDEDSLEGVASVQKSLPPGSGDGYYVAMSSNADGQLDYSYQGNAGRVGVGYARRDGEDGWRAIANGGLAVTSVGVMPARSLNESFAIVELADFGGVTVYLDNQPVGRTDQHGRVLLDALRAYEDNAVSIDPAEIPIDASLSNPAMTVTPAYRSGPVVKFPVIRASAATLRLVQTDGTPVPAGATVTTDDEQVPVAANGLVYLTSADGERRAQATWSAHRCDFHFVRPSDAGPQPDLGDVTCVAAPARPQ